MTGTDRATGSPVVVSLTTIQARNGTLGPALSSIAAQSGVPLPYEVRVYATAGCVRPAALYGAAWIGPVFDYGPLTKLSAVRDLALPDDAIVVTCDDDQIYDPRWLATLVAAARAHPACAVGLSGWNARGFLAGAAGRDHYEWVRPPSVCDVLEGFAGVAYRRGFFDEGVWDVPDSCRRVDDVWISGYLHRRGVVRRVTDSRRCRPAPSDASGLHTRGDFVAQNRAAARMMFGSAGRMRSVEPVAEPARSATVMGIETAAGTTTAPKLSICIPSLASRHELLGRLLECLRRQGRSGEVEILVDLDQGTATTGAKRNRLVARASGAYVCHVDDDDLVAPDYVATILAAIDDNPGVDVLWIRGRRRVVGSDGRNNVLIFDYGCSPGADGHVVDGALWRRIGHLCPIRFRSRRRRRSPT